MPQTPKRAGRTPHPGTLFPSQIVARNVQSFRALRGFSQDDVAERMRFLRHETWSRATVSEIERGDRNVTVDELASLCLVLGAWGPGDLMDPARPRVHLDLGMTGPLTGPKASDWAHGRLLIELEKRADPEGWLYAFEEPEDPTMPEWLQHRAQTPEEP